MINGRENSEGVTIKVVREVREGLTGKVVFEQNPVGDREGTSTEKLGKEEGSPGGKPLRYHLLILRQAGVLQGGTLELPESPKSQMQEDTLKVCTLFFQS